MKKNKVRNFEKIDWVESYIFYSRANLKVCQIPEVMSENTIRYKLVCEAIEFLLKVFLCCFDYELSDLKNKFGHNIYSLASILSSEWSIRGSQNILNSDDLATIKRVSDLYEDKSLHYPNEYSKDVPSFLSLVKIAKVLLENLELQLRILKK